jgi:hypothetical protein
MRSCCPLLVLTAMYLTTTVAMGRKDESSTMAAIMKTRRKQ